MSPEYYFYIFVKHISLFFSRLLPNHILVTLLVYLYGIYPSQGKDRGRESEGGRDRGREMVEFLSSEFFKDCSGNQVIFLYSIRVERAAELCGQLELGPTTPLEIPFMVWFHLLHN